READLNHRPSGYEPDELPDCSIPRRFKQHNTYFLNVATPSQKNQGPKVQTKDKGQMTKDK
ncbi:MAG: hypothetical protein ACOC07_10805, partial [Coleofasciculus sp.]